MSAGDRSDEDESSIFHPKGRTRTIRVLHVEDSDGEALAVQVMLKNAAGYSFDVERSRNVRAALTRLSADPLPHVILLDLGLPDSDGLETVTKVRQAAPDVPVVVITGMRDEDLDVKALELGASDYVVKGQTDGRSLVRSIRFALERDRRRRAEERLRATNEQMRSARAIQERLFPRAVPQLPGLRIAGKCVPADATGGDYYDYIPLPDGGWGMSVGDVSSHGFGPAILMAEVRILLRTLARTCREPGQILAEANRTVVEDTASHQFVTAFLAQIDPQGRSFTYAGAGHEAYLLQESGQALRLRSTGLPLGISVDARYATSSRVDLSPGQVLLIYTDGITDTRSVDKGLFGPARTLDCVRRHRAEAPERIVQALCTESREFARPSPIADDMTVVVVKVE